MASVADDWVRDLAQATASRAIAALDGATLLGERAALRGLATPGQVSAGGGCRLYPAKGGTVALNLARPDDRDLLPALFEREDLDLADDMQIAAEINRCEAETLVLRGRMMGLAIAGEAERRLASPLVTELLSGPPTASRTDRPPRVLDLSALWAGPLAAHLLQLAGAEVVKVESRTRPDAMREGDPLLYDRLDAGKARLDLDFRSPDDIGALLAQIAAADVVIEASRPRALAQLGVNADALVRARPGLVWITITGHGALGEAADWVGFGDDCGVAAGLSAALRRATGRTGFVGDAIADPLTGVLAARTAWSAWKMGRGGRFGLAMSGVAAHALAEMRHKDPVALDDNLVAWAAAQGAPFPRVSPRSRDRTSRPIVIGETATC